MNCPRCESSEGQVKSGRNRSGSQRYECKLCRKVYTPQPKAHGYSAEVRQQALKLTVDGTNFRRTARQIGVNHQTVINWFSQATAKLPEAPEPTSADVIEMDELFSFTGKKSTKSTW